MKQQIIAAMENSNGTWNVALVNNGTQFMVGRNKKEKVARRMVKELLQENPRAVVKVLDY